MSTFVKSTLPGWEDTVRTPQDDGANPVVAINYPEDFKELMDLFRTVLVTKEHSPRVLQLTEDILERNAGNYTVWQYRRECLLSLNSNLHEELDYLDTYADENPKNYQIWFHRRVIVEAVNDPSRELKFTEDVIESDSKNYHAWSHRQWVLRTFGRRPELASKWWEDELRFLDDLVVIDVRNNSAWNQRWFVVHERPYGETAAGGSGSSSGAVVEVEVEAGTAAVGSTRRTSAVPSDVLQAEVAYTTKSISKATLNESSWNYLRGLWNLHGREDAAVQQLVEQFCVDMAADKSHSGNYFLYALLADIRERQAEDASSDPERRLQCKGQAREHLLHLAKVDKLRVKYWTVRAEEVMAVADAGAGTEAGAAAAVVDGVSC